MTDLEGGVQQSRHLSRLVRRMIAIGSFVLVAAIGTGLVLQQQSSHVLEFGIVLVDSSDRIEVASAADMASDAGQECWGAQQYADLRGGARTEAWGLPGHLLAVGRLSSGVVLPASPGSDLIRCQFHTTLDLPAEDGYYIGLGQWQGPYGFSREDLEEDGWIAGVIAGCPACRSTGSELPSG